MSKLLEQFSSARRVGTPLISITCYDQAATVAQITSSIDKPELTPIIQWDAVRGWVGVNKYGARQVEIVNDEYGDNCTVNEVKSLDLASRLPERSIVFICNSHRFLDNDRYDRTRFTQAIANLRDDFASSLKTLVFLSPSIMMPLELKQDVLMLDEELPTSTQLREIIDTTVDAAGVSVDETTREKAVDALRGIAAFPSEQATAMSISREGLDVQALWGRKRSMINETPGLKVYAGSETFDSIGGCDSIKSFLRNIINGKEAPRVIVFIDEGEKMFAGATHEIGDNTGIAQDSLMTTLTYMEDHEADGVILVGPPGAAKSAVAKSMGNEAGVPTIMLDFGGMRAGIVGESERKLRDAYKIIDAVGGGRAYFIMTCNKDVTLPPELKRRFTSGTFFFDLPSDEERQIIWNIYLQKYGFDLKTTPIPIAENWTGAEIRNACRMAYRQNISIMDAAKYIVPVARSAAEQIEILRRKANNVYLSANTEGVYRWEKDVEPLQRQKRKFASQG